MGNELGKGRRAEMDAGMDKGMDGKQWEGDEGAMKGAWAEKEGMNGHWSEEV